MFFYYQYIHSWVNCLLKDHHGHHLHFYFPNYLTILFRARGMMLPLGLIRSYWKDYWHNNIYSDYIWYFHFLNLTFPRRWDCFCRQDVKNSEFWFSVAPSGLNMIRNFSRRQSLQTLVTVLKGAARPMISQEILYGIFWSFNFQM